MIELEPLHPHFVAEARGVDLRSPLSSEDISIIEKAMDRFAVLIWHGQRFDEEQQIAFARQFGQLDMGLRKAYGGAHRFKNAELIDISNVGMDGEVTGRAHAKTISNLANQLWHSDSSFQQPAAKYSMLSAVVLPERGGETEFCDLRAAYDSIADERIPRRSSRPCRRSSGRWCARIRARSASCSGSGRTRRTSSGVPWAKGASFSPSCSSTRRSASSSFAMPGASATS